MNLTDQQLAFISKRKTLLRLWRIVWPFMLAGVIAFAGFIWFQSPLLINPAEIIGRIQSGAVERTTLETMATVLPVMVIIIVVLMLALVGVMYAAFANEKKYITLMEDRGAGGESSPESGADKS